MRIALYSERLTPPFDEGIKNVAWHLIRELRGRHDVLALTAVYGFRATPFRRSSRASAIGEKTVAGPSGGGEEAEGIISLPANPLLLSPALARALWRFRPDLVLYIPTACATPFSFWRSRMLKRWSRGAPVALIALQVRRYSPMARRVMARLRPEVVLAQSAATRESLKPVGVRLLTMPPAVDLVRFRPHTPAEREALRRRYDLPVDAFLALHVGHLNRGRNVHTLAALQSDGVQVLVVGSSSTPHDAALIAELAGAGVRVIDRHVPRVEELYGLADAYCFPVRGENSAIDLPLSVLEAMACDLPVVTTRYGGLTAHFAEGEGFRYVDDAAQMGAALGDIRGQVQSREPGAGTRAMVQPYAWPDVAQRVVGAVCAELGIEG